jgi:hypothetical protein
VQATNRFRQQLVDDRVEVFDACPRHADLVRARLDRRRADHPEAVLDVRESTPPRGTPCPYDRSGCRQDACDRHDDLIPATVEDGQLMGTS